MRSASMYKNSLRSEAKIREAVISLLSEKKDINKVTISEVVDRAGVNRGTFYNHYKGIDEVLGQIEDKFMSELVYKWNSFMTLEDSRFDAFIATITNSFKTHEAEYKNIVQSVPHYVSTDFRKKFKEVLERSAQANEGGKNHPDHAYFVFLAGGISSAYLDYFLGVSPFSLDQLADYSISLVGKLYPELISNKR